MPRYLFIALMLSVAVGLTPAFAEQVILSEGTEYEIAEITEERKFKGSHIIKTQGFTTTGDMFFIYTSDRTDFQKVMFLDRTGHWQKAELTETTVQEEKPISSVVIEEKTDFHYILDQIDRVYNRDQYQFFLKGFDKSVYSGDDFNSFQGIIKDDIKVTAIIVSPDGEIRGEIEAVGNYGIYEGSITVPENLWERGWYAADIKIEFEDKVYYEQLTFYVFGNPQPDSDSKVCPEGQILVNGVCVTP